jgi:DNA-directed RNA polymerase subunit RPC12/RpoP
LNKIVLIMIRGITLMKCTQCRKRFWGVDIELYASTLSQPLRCPKCGSVRTRPSRLFCPFSSDIVYKKVWNQFDPTLQK